MLREDFASVESPQTKTEPLSWRAALLLIVGGAVGLWAMIIYSFLHLL